LGSILRNHRPHGYNSYFIKYAYARSGLCCEGGCYGGRSAASPQDAAASPQDAANAASSPERSLALTLENIYVIEQAGIEMSPSVVAGYAFELCQDLQFPL